jgi:hypothetical protein
MTREQTAKIVVEAMWKIQEANGDQYPGLLPSDVPIRCLDGFDSYRGLEVTAELEAILGCDLPETIFNSKSRAFSLEEAIECAWNATSRLDRVEQIDLTLAE